MNTSLSSVAPEVAGRGHRLGRDDEILARLDREDARPVRAAGSTATPSTASLPAIRSRIGALFDPMPPVKTIASRRGRAVAAAAMAAAARRTNIASARAARSSPEASASRSARTSDVRPETPRSPEAMVEAVRELGGREAPVEEQPRHDARVDRAGPRPHHQALERRHAHRRLDRSTAVHSGDRAAAAQVRDDDREAQPRRGRGGRAACDVDQATDRPWNPKRRTPHSSNQRSGTG